MNPLEKLQVLGGSAAYDRCGCECSPKEARTRKRTGIPLDGIYPATRPDGSRTLLLKVLQSNHCTSDCSYCMNRHGRGCRRSSFESMELASVFQNYLRLGYVEGLFLSSGVSRDAEASMDSILETVELVRLHGFMGYVHTKILPGASRDQVKRAAELSTRLSVNIEAPSRQRLSELSSQKEYLTDLVRRMRWVKQEVKRGLVVAGQTTQFVVGAAGEPDQEVLKTVEYLYRKMNLTRVYYSSFKPIRETPLEDRNPVSLQRQNRLYQADYLLRDYGFGFKDLVFSGDGHLPQGMDPKMAYALEHRDLFPVDINQAGYRELLQVPGIGPKTANKIIQARRDSKIRSHKELRKLMIPGRSEPFLELDGQRQARLVDY